MTQPRVGTPRPPDLIRVADAATAAEVLAEVGDRVSATVARRRSSMSFWSTWSRRCRGRHRTRRAYFVAGQDSSAGVKGLFVANLALFAVKPRTVTADARVFRMDIPEPDIEGVCGPSSVATNVRGGAPSVGRGLLLLPGGRGGRRAR